MPSGLALIFHKLVSVLTLIADEIVSCGLTLIVYELVSVLTLISDEIVPLFDIASVRACVCVDIDS